MLTSIGRTVTRITLAIISEAGMLRAFGRDARANLRHWD